MDSGLKGLFDYTKFHIGLYTGLISLSVGLAKFIDRSGQEHLYWLRVTLGLLVLAGMCGGIVGSNAYEHETLKGFEDVKIGLFGWKPLKGKTWAHWEHLLFWLAVLAATVSVFVPY